MKPQLVKKRKFVEMETLEEELTELLANEAIKLASFKEEVQAEYHEKFEEVWAFLRKRSSYKEYKTLKDNYNARAKLDTEALHRKYKLKVKSFCNQASKSVQGLARVADTVDASLAQMQKVFARAQKEFRLSEANPYIMFENLFILEELQMATAGLELTVKHCQSENQRHIQSAKRNMYLSSYEQ